LGGYCGFYLDVLPGMGNVVIFGMIPALNFRPKKKKKTEATHSSTQHLRPTGFSHVFPGIFSPKKFLMFFWLTKSVIRRAFYLKSETTNDTQFSELKIGFAMK